MKRLSLVLIFCALAAASGLADVLIELPEFVTTYPGEQVAYVTMPDDLFSLSHLAIQITHLSTPGLWFNPSSGEEEPYSLSMNFLLREPVSGIEGGAMIYGVHIHAPGTDIELFNIHGDLQQLEGRKVEVRVAVWQLDDPIEPASIEVQSAALRLIGNVVATDAVTFSAVKQLFD
jgi:hypothetical protein